MNHCFLSQIVVVVTRVFSGQWIKAQGSRLGVGRKLLAALLIQINIPNSES
jgi:hypothetical protein